MMNDLFIYLAKVSAGLAIIFLPYYFLFPKRSQPGISRGSTSFRNQLLPGSFPFITFRKLPLALDLTPTVFIDLEAPATQAVQLESAGTSPD